MGGANYWHRRHSRGLADQLGEVSPFLSQRLCRSLESCYEKFLAEPRDFQCRQCLLHHEVHAGHVLMVQGHVRGVIDWRFARVGVPAWELSPWSAHFGTMELRVLSLGRISPYDETFSDGSSSIER